MRILQVCTKPPYPPRDGGSLAMFSLASSISRLGHAITVLTMVTDKHKLSDEKRLKFAELMNLHVVYVDTTPHWLGLIMNLIFSRQPYNARRFQSKTFENELIRILKTEKQDVVQLEGLYLIPYIPLIRKYSNALIALRAHNIEHVIWSRIAATEKKILRKLYFKTLANRIKRFEHNCINRYDLLVPITNLDLEKFTGMGNVCPALVCHAGIDVDSDAVNTNFATINAMIDHSSVFSLFFLGSLDWIPNQEGLLWFVAEVFPLLYKHFPNLKLHIAGRNAPGNLIKKLNVPGVVFHGEIDDSKEFMKAYSILVVPCFSGSGMRIKIIEAMGVGKPVITTPIGAEGLNVKHDENIIIAVKTGEFIQHIERLMNYPDLYVKIRQNAYDYVAEKFNNMIIAAELAGFYKAHLK
jgi:glycosyltransferase involved in cell wall biosynthesis